MGQQQDTTESFVALPSSGGDKISPETTLAELLNSQFISTEWDDIFAATEIREHEIPLMAAEFMNRFITEILSSRGVIGEIADPDKVFKTTERMELRKRILSDPNAMAFSIRHSYWHAFGLLRKSLKRASREEGVRVSTASITRAYSGEEVGIGQQLLSKFGIGKYRVAYMPGEKA